MSSESLYLLLDQYEEELSEESQKSISLALKHSSLKEGVDSSAPQFIFDNFNKYYGYYTVDFGLSIEGAETVDPFIKK